MVPLTCDNCDEIPDNIVLSNTGELIMIKLIYENVKKLPKIGRGPMFNKGDYRFHYMYFNFLPEIPEEWSLNNISFPAELHLVFYNERRENYENALERDEGIVIVSMGFQVQEVNASTFLPLIINELSNIRSVGKNTTLPVVAAKLPFSSFLPHSLEHYHTYEGTMLSPRAPSHTTCKSRVIWIDFDETHKIPADYIHEFFMLKTFVGFSHLSYDHDYGMPRTQIRFDKRNMDPEVRENTKQLLENGQDKMKHFMSPWTLWRFVMLVLIL
ncbi:carbonic anhydrase 6-like [Musca domestica]|uniref:carbonic anhydrase n=1 Tax=Musca domestica TaxID=7370 RepID=A0ABM3ULH7_MUSDO|nr:carbonic anhydrase 6-like [Musca domestica]